MLFHLSRLLCILSTAVPHLLLLLLLLSRCSFRLFRVPFRSLLISVTPRLLIIVFLARAPQCIVPKRCCLSCPHLDLVTLQSSLPYLFDLMLVCYYLALCIFNCSDRAVWLVQFSHALDFLIEALHRLCFSHISFSWLPYSDHALSLVGLITCLHASLAD